MDYDLFIFLKKMFYLFKEHKWEGSREQFRTFIPKHLQFAFFLSQKTEQINRVRDICTLVPSERPTASLQLV